MKGVMRSFVETPGKPSTLALMLPQRGGGVTIGKVTGTG